MHSPRIMLIRLGEGGGGTSNVVGTWIIVAEKIVKPFSRLSNQKSSVLLGINDKRDWYRIAPDFKDKWDFPRTIGAMGGGGSLA